MLRVRLSLTLALAALPVLWAACGGDEDPDLSMADGSVNAVPGGTPGAGFPDAGGATPGGTTAGGTVAGGTVSGGTVAGGTVSGGTVAGGTVSGGTVSGGTVAGGTVSGGTVSGGTVSGGTVAGGTPSGGTVSGGTPSGGTVSGGTPSGGTASGTTTGGTTGGGATGGVGGMDPIIPDFAGQCPEIREGQSTVTVNGTKVKLWVGAKKEGTGSFLAYFYGTGKIGSTADFMLPAAVRNDVVAQGGIVYAPEEAKNTGGDCSGTGTFGIDDFVTVDQMVACAVKNWGINPKRIYATGCSAGGLTSGCLSIRRSNYIAAVMPNSGGITTNYGKLQGPGRVPNVITMNGGTNDNVIVNFDDTSQYLDNAILKAGGFTVNCVHTGGHCGAPAALYQSAWQFLKDHPYGTKPSPYAAGLPSGFSSLCKIFTGSTKTGFGGGI